MHSSSTIKALFTCLHLVTSLSWLSSAFNGSSFSISCAVSFCLSAPRTLECLQALSF